MREREREGWREGERNNEDEEDIEDIIHQQYLIPTGSSFASYVEVCIILTSETYMREREREGWREGGRSDEDE